MSVRHERGRAGEDYVCGYLTGLGWRISERNYRIRGGEIDIIAEKGCITAFVEVKTRKFGSLADGIEAVDAKKRACILKAADRFIEEHPEADRTIRFDAAEVIITTEEIPRVLEIKYYEDAFDAFTVC
ncbi:MAG: YraN family protein [Ruminiclostridium sp.]|nr:YraN family protein [Ruminiclostridium sp.]